LSTEIRSNKLNRKDLSNQVVREVQASATMAVFFHTTMAERIGISTIEEKTLHMLSSGRLTAGELSKRTGLANASITSLIDRLEQKGYVRRERDEVDRRKVFVALQQERFAELTARFDSMQFDYEAVLDHYKTGELATIADFLTRLNEYSQNWLRKTEPRANTELT